LPLLKLPNNSLHQQEASSHVAQELVKQPWPACFALISNCNGFVLVHWVILSLKAFFFIDRLRMWHCVNAPTNAQTGLPSASRQTPALAVVQNGGSGMVVVQT
jgi:hypothetical protein